MRDYVDNDVSASTGKRRPEYEALLGDIRAGVVTAVVVWDIDRLTRRPIEIEQFIELTDDHGVALASVGGDVDIATDSGRMFLRVQGAVARAEVDAKSRRQRRQRQQTAEAGMRSGGPRPFGYTPDGMHLDPDEAPVLTDMYRQFLTAGSLGAVARSLNARGITTPRGNPWSYASVKAVLANPRNAGLRGVRPLRPGREGRAGLREAWHEVVGKAAWPAVVDELTWNAALAALRGSHRYAPRPATSTRYLLSGLARCGVCGEPLRSGRRQGTRILRCPSLRHIARRADRIENLVVDVLLARMARPDAAAVFGAAQPATVDLGAVRARQAALRARLEDNDADSAKLRIDRATYFRVRRMVHEELDEIDEQLAEAGRLDPTAPLAGASDPREVWDGLSVETQRRVVDRLMVVTVLPGAAGQPGGRRFDPETVRIVWR